MFPDYRNKIDKVVKLYNRKYNFTELDRIKPFKAGLVEGRNVRQSLQNLINGYAMDAWHKNYNPSYVGRIVVVDTPERPIESYRIGDVVAIGGTDDVAKYAIGRIQAIDLGMYDAELTLSRVLINSERRLKALEIDNKNN